jgi:serine protease
MADEGIVTMTNTGATNPDSTYTMKSNIAGTSYAAPTAAGVAALMLAVDPSLSVADLLTALTTQVEPFSSATPFGGACSASNRGNCTCTTATCGAGMLDAGKAVAWAIRHAEENPGAPPYSADTQVAIDFKPDRLNPLSPSNTRSSGASAGGGAMSWPGLLWLAMALAWRVLPGLNGLRGGRPKSPCPVAA